MGIEKLNNSAPEKGSYDEGLQDQLMSFVDEIKAKLIADSQHDINGHWAAAVYRLSVAAGSDNVNNALAANNWDKDTFPQELL